MRTDEGIPRRGRRLLQGDNGLTREAYIGEKVLCGPRGRWGLGEETLQHMTTNATNVLAKQIREGRTDNLTFVSYSGYSMYKTRALRVKWTTIFIEKYGSTAADLFGSSACVIDAPRKRTASHLSSRRIEAIVIFGILCVVRLSWPGITAVSVSALGGIIRRPLNDSSCVRE